MTKPSATLIACVIFLSCALSINQNVWSQQDDSASFRNEASRGSDPITTERENDFISLRELADQHRETKDFEKARRIYEKALEIRPDDSHSLFWVATLYRWTHRYLMAEEAYRLILQDHPEHVDAKIGLVYVLLFQRRTDESRRLAEEVLEDRPENSDALMVYARILENQGSVKEAEVIYRQLVEARPQDPTVRTRHQRIKEKARPSIRGRYRFSQTKVLEGRGDPISVTRTEYLTEGYGLEGRAPLSNSLTFTALLQKKRVKLTLLELNDVIVNRTIYDFDTTTYLFGSSYRTSPKWTFNGQVGIKHYENRNPGSVEQDNFSQYHLNIQYSDRHHDGNLGFLRRPFLGRSAGGELDFRIFTESQGSVRYQRILQDGFTVKARFSISDFSDENTTFTLSTGLESKKKPHRWAVTLNKKALQARFLTNDLRLKFIDIYGIRLDYSRGLLAGLEMTSYARYRFYEDHNQEQQLVARLEYSLTKTPNSSIGLEEEVDHFNRDAKDYNNISILSRTTAYYKVHHLIGVNSKIDLKVWVSVISDEGDRLFADSGVRGALESILATALRMGIQGELEINSLSDRRAKLIAYLHIIF